MFKSFFDESGTGDDDPVCVMAGFAGNADECDRVAREWEELVRTAGPGEFHAHEFWSRVDGKMTGIYKNMSVTQAEYHVEDLINLLKGSQLTPIGLALDSNAFRSLHQDERRYLTSHVLYGKDWPSQGAPSTPYFMAFHYFLNAANGYTPEGETMYVTFDLHRQYESTAQRMYSDLLKLGGQWSGRLADAIVYASRFRAVLLQASDLLAHAIMAALPEPSQRDRIAQYALESLAWEKDFVRVMDIKGLDHHLKPCFCRRTFWPGLTSPDLIEKARIAGGKVLAIKGSGGVYLSHHISADQITRIKAD
jgi:hypothetical protein